MGLGSLAVDKVKAGFARLGVVVQRSRPVRDTTIQLVVKMAEIQVCSLVDVGANAGQFAQAARRAGYRGKIWSIEPLQEAHAACARAAAKDPDWQVVGRMALGSARTTARINVARNLASSSFMEVDARSIAAAPESGFRGTEEVEIRTLDELAVPAWARPLALKIDTQGFEREVIEGAAATLPYVKLILIEMSLLPLYKGAPTFVELYALLEARGYRCIGLTQGFADLRRHELLQVDGLFIRD